MMKGFGNFINKYRRLLPLTATIILFVIAYSVSAIYLPGMRDIQVFLNLLNQTPYLLVAVVGETLVVLSGGIDLSVAGIVPLVTTASAALIQNGWNPWMTMLLMIVIGTAMGAIMGYFITYMKVQPFIATLAGLFVGRGLAYFISNNSLSINDRTYEILSRTKILIPGLSDVVAQKGPYITPSVIFGLIIFVIAIYVSLYTRFGRTVYAIGGKNGANEQSAKLMGLPVNRTKMLVYTINGFCSALAGILLSIYTGSGHGMYGTGLEMTVIAAVVIGGTALTGGEGYVFGAIFGTLITILIQTIIQIQGTLISWWTLIVIGLITLFFIGMQSFFSNLKVGQVVDAASRRKRNRRFIYVASGLIGLVVITILAVKFIEKPAAVEKCTLQPFRQDLAADLVEQGAVIAYERNGGAKCIDEVYGIFPDGRILADNGIQKIEKQLTPEQVDNLVSYIVELDWFTDKLYSTTHLPCGVCYYYFTTVTYNGEAKTVEAVDGGTDAPSQYWAMTGRLHTLLPKFDPLAE